MQGLNILHLSPWFPYPLDTGSRTRVYHLLQALAIHHKVTLLTLDPQGWAPAQLDVVVPLCKHAVIIPRDPFQRSRLRMATRFFSSSPVVTNPFPELLDLVADLHAAKPFDAVIAGTAIMAPYALALSGITRVLEEHNSGTRWMAERYQVQVAPLQRLRCWVSWRKARRYESQLFPRFDLVSMVSEQDAAVSRALVAGDAPPVMVFPNGVDCTQLHPGLAEPQQDTLVFSGALTYHANYEAMQFFLSKVYPRIRQARPGVKLRITGQADGVDLAGLHLDESVTFTGFVEDIRLEIAGAQISVVPIKSGGGTRLKILEAMALGTPVISTTKGAEGIEAVDGEHLLLADNPVEFANRVMQLLQDADLRQRLAANARLLVKEKYDWATITRQFVAAIEGAVDSRRARRAV